MTIEPSATSDTPRPIALTWREPPAKMSATSRPSWQPIRDALKANPGRWALIGEGRNSGIAHHLKRGGFEAVTRNHRTVDGKKVSDVYARWPEVSDAV